MQLILAKFFTTINKDEYVTAEYVNVIFKENKRMILNKVFSAQEGPLPDVLSNSICFEILCYAILHNSVDVVGKYENIEDVKCYDLPTELTICYDLQSLGVIK